MALTFGLASLTEIVKGHGSLTYTLATTFIFLLILYTYSIVTYDKRRKHLPPGPRGLPFIGNLTDLFDQDKVPQLIRRWAQDHGPLVYTRIGYQDWIWLNSPKMVKDLLDKRSTIYSSRPHLPMAFDATSSRKRQFFMPYGDDWRNVRKVSHAALNLPSSNSYRPVQDFESKQLMYEFLHVEDDEGFYQKVRRYAASVVLTITYGIQVSDFNDPVIKQIWMVIEHFTLMSAPGSWLVDAFPILTKLPGWMVQNWWNIGQEWFKFDSAVYGKLYQDLVTQIKAGTAPDCFVKDFYMKDPEKNGIDEVGAAYIAGSLVEAGSESTATMINAWIIACLLYPDAAKKAQEELDRVVGSDRLPSYDDEDDLLYIRAMLKETLRWWPITKFPIPHATTEDDWYEGYFIPKGSAVMINWWAIHFDPNKWKDPDSYDPSRYLDDPYTTAELVHCANPEERDHFTYGAGRRVCAGLHVAQNSLFINMARTLWAFNIKKPLGQDGQPIDFVPETESGFVMVPKKFRAVFEPRSPKHAEIVEQSWIDAKKEGLKYIRTRKLA